MCYPGDTFHGAQYRCHEEVLEDTLFYPGAEFIVLVVRLIHLLLLYDVRSQHL